MELHEHVSLKALNTFHIAATTRYFVNATTLRDLKEAVAFAQAKKLPFLLVGQGSNLLFRDNYPGLIIEMNLRERSLIERRGEDVLIKAACGEVWHDFVRYCLDNDWYGLENLSLIPGTVGAAPVQNIGAYGVEISQRLHSLQALAIESGELHEFSNEDCEFSYRNSIFKQGLRDRFIITSVTFLLSTRPTVDIEYRALKDELASVKPEKITPRLVSDTVCRIRRSKLPDPGKLGNAGSFFWNPQVSRQTLSTLQEKWPDIVAWPEGELMKIPAAWLIEKAGWKGYREGDVGVHQDHALVLVNHGQASGEQLYQLAMKIRDSVLDLSGIELQPEVRIIHAGQQA